jgi:hypothetical protein
VGGSGGDLFKITITEFAWMAAGKQKTLQTRYQVYGPRIEY